MTDTPTIAGGHGRSSEVAVAVHAAHDYLFKQAGLDPAHSYDEILRVLAALARSRRTTESAPSDGVAAWVRDQAGSVLDELGVQGALSFGSSSLAEPVLRELLTLLQEIDLDRSVDNEDPFGVMFQQVVTSTFRASLGAYFTPNPIADFIAEVLDPEADALVVDPAAGSGGLLAAMLRSARKSHKTVRLGALDINPRMVLTEALNFYVLRADVHQLVLGDGLLEAPCDPGTADYVVANPPFAGFERRPEVLTTFKTAQSNGTVRSLNKTIPFVERILSLLRTGGTAGLVVPISIFNAEESTFVELRRLITETCEVDAVMGLPTVAFEHTDCGIAGGLLFLTKKARPRRTYPVFIAQAESVGYDSIGYPIGSNDLPDILNEYQSGAGPHFVDRAEIPPGERIDPQWWSPASRALRAALDQGAHNVPLTDICRVVRRPLQRRAIPAEASVEYFEVRDTDPEFGIILETHEIQGSGLGRKGRIKQVVQTGDVLLPNHRDSLSSKAGDGTGRSAVLVTEAFDGVATTDRFIVLESLVEENLLIALLNSPNVRRQLIMLARGSASLDIRDSVLESVMIPDLTRLPERAVDELSRAVADFRGLREHITNKRGEIQALVESVLPAVE